MSSTDDEKKLPWWGYLLIFGGTIVLAIIIYVIYRKISLSRQLREQAMMMQEGVQQFGGALSRLWGARK